MPVWLLLPASGSQGSLGTAAPEFSHAVARVARSSAPSRTGQGITVPFLRCVTAPHCVHLTLWLNLDGQIAN